MVGRVDTSNVERFLRDTLDRGSAIRETATMAFGQQSGPPASSSQLKQLLALLQDAGYADFRDARGPLGLTQRQAGGKFTRDEADALIGQLEAAQDGDEVIEVADAAPKVAPPRRTSQTDAVLSRVPAERLAAELQRRGWIVVEP